MAKGGRPSAGSRKPGQHPPEQPSQQESNPATEQRPGPSLGDPPPQHVRRDPRQAFDPQDYLTDPDFTFWYSAGHLRALERYRHALYGLYARLLKPELVAHHEEEDKALFLEFLTHFRSDMRISYGLLTTLVHAYLCYASMVRVLYCPGTWAPGTWSAWLLPAWSPLSCPARPRTYVDWVGWLQVAYYWGMAVTHRWWPRAEKALAIFGTQLVNGALCTVFWLAPQTPGYRYWYLSGSSAFPAGAGAWRALYLPIIYFWTFLFLRRNYLGLVFWEYEDVDLSLLVHGPEGQAPEPEQREPSPSRSDSTAPTPPSASPRPPRMAYLWVYRLFSLFSGLCPLLVWELWLKPETTLPPEYTDVVRWPGSLLTLALSLCIMLAFGLWISFLLFQHKLIAWSIPLREGVVFEHDERELKIGLIY